MNNLRELRKTYGAAATFAIAYGAGNEVASKFLKDKPRIAKKKLNKLRTLFQSAHYCFGIDWGETLTIKAKYKKGCRKGKSYVKVLRVKDETVYCTVAKHRHIDSDSGEFVWNNKIENLTWIPSTENFEEK